MKKFPIHRRIVLILGIGVAIAIAIAMWTAPFGTMGMGTGTIEEPRSLTPQFADFARQSASALYRAADIIVSTTALTEE